MRERPAPSGSAPVLGDDQALLLAALQAIVDRLEALPARIAAELQRAHASTVTPADRRLLARLLPRISAEVGDDWWTLADLGGDAPDLHRQLLKSAGAGGTAPERAVGRFLARADRLVVDDLRIERGGRVRGGTLWRCVRLRK